MFEKVLNTPLNIILNLFKVDKKDPRTTWLIDAVVVSLLLPMNTFGKTFPSRPLYFQSHYWKHQSNICYFVKINIKNTRMRSITFSFLSLLDVNVFIVNFEQLSHIIMVFPLLTLNE